MLSERLASRCEGLFAVQHIQQPVRGGLVGGQNFQAQKQPLPLTGEPPAVESYFDHKRRQLSCSFSVQAAATSAASPAEVNT
mgnify:CR=1 FL=1